MVSERVKTNLDKLLACYLDRPLGCFGGGCVVLLLLSVLSVLSGSMGLTLDQNSAWSVHSGTFTKAWEGFKQARQNGEEERRLQEVDANGPIEIILLYKAASGTSSFTPELLQDICMLEGDLLRTGPGSVCDTTEDGRLRCPRYSPAQTFYGNLSTAFANDCPLLSQTSIDATVSTIATAVQQYGSSSSYANLITPGFLNTNTTTYTRSSYTVWGEDREKTEKFLLDNLFSKFEPSLSYGFLSSAFQGEDDRMVQYRGMRVRVFADFDEFMRMLPADFSLAFCSMIFVLATMYLHLGSFFLACFGMWQIVASLPIGALFYRQLFRVEYFEFLHILVVYLVLGVGADDIFVILDSWRHVKGEHGIRMGKAGGKRETMLVALRETWIRTAGAIFNTSFTTGVAFMSMSVSGVMPMKTCGWFAAIAIILNYVFTIFFTPSLLVVHQYYFGGKRCCCPNPAKPVPLQSEESAAATAVNEQDGNGCFARTIEQFLHRVYLPMMQRRMGPIKPVPLAFVVIMAAVGVQGAYFASQLTPPSKQEQWFPNNHMWLDLSEFISATFYAPDHERYEKTWLVWGMEDMDFAEFNQYKPDDNPPQLVYDSSFDLSTMEAQQAFLRTCDRVRELACSAVGCRGGDGFALRVGSQRAVSCPLEDFRRWLNSTQGTTVLPQGTSFVQLLRQFRDEAQPKTFGLSAEVAEVVDSSYRDNLGFASDGRIQHAAIQVRSTMLQQEPYGSGVDVRKLLQDFVQQQLDEGMPASMSSLKVASDRFANFDLGQELVSGLFSGMAIAGPLVFVVLLFSTLNIVLALYAVISVAGIVVSVLGFCKSAMDYDLGVGEAIAGIIVIGYSVDYVVHFAHTYCEAARHGISDRDGRAAFTIKNMGSTVFAGALTTAGSGVFMFFCFLTFFTKMALLICMTIFFSFLFSLCFFMGLCFVVGPEGNFGNFCCCLKGSQSEPASGKETEASTNSSSV